MSDWKALLRQDPTSWLLEEDDPSARYFTLRDILGKPEQDPDVQMAKEAIMQRGVVPEMLKIQEGPEYLKTYPRFYTAKYRGLVWSLIVLSELGAQAVPQIREQCEYLLSNSQEPTEGGFSQTAAAKTGGGRMREVIPCLTGNMVWSLIRLGYLGDARLQKGIDWLVRFMRYNDGVETNPQVPRYGHYDMCWGAHTCHMGVVKALKAFSAIPPEKRTDEINDAISKAAEFMLIHHIYKKSHDLGKKSKPGWLKFGFPLMYQTDVLEILDILTALGYKDERMDDAVKIVLGKQDPSGRWALENTYCSDRLLIPMGQPGAPNKHLTLRAMRVLKALSE